MPSREGISSLNKTTTRKQSLYQKSRMKMFERRQAGVISSVVSGVTSAVDNSLTQSTSSLDPSAIVSSITQPIGGLSSVLAIPSTSSSATPASSSSSSSSDSASTSSSSPSSTPLPSSTSSPTPSTSSSDSSSSTSTSSSVSNSSSISSSTSTSTSTSSSSSSSTLPPSSSITSSIPSSTIPSSTSLSSISGSSYSAFLQTVNGVVQTVYSPVPTLNTESPSVTSERRTAIVVGSAVGGAFLFLICLAGAFCYKRRQRKQYEKVNQRRPQPRSLLLAGEDDFDPGDPDLPPMLLRPRGNDTGSLFQEGVWPPPSERSRLTDPLMAASAVTFDNIVDSVMGPSPPTSPTPRPGSRLRGGSGSEMDEDSLYQRAGGRQTSFISDHQREYSVESLLNHNRRYPSYSYSTQDESPQQSRQASAPGSPYATTSTIPRNWIERSPRLPQSESTATITQAPTNATLIDFSPNEPLTRSERPNTPTLEG